MPSQQTTLSLLLGLVRSVSRLIFSAGVAPGSDTENGTFNGMMTRSIGTHVHDCDSDSSLATGGARHSVPWRRVMHKNVGHTERKMSLEAQSEIWLARYGIDSNVESQNAVVEL